MTSQKALVLSEKHGIFEVRDVPMPSPDPGELLVEVRAASLNPVDWVIQVSGIHRDEYPAILGSDSAGVVKQVGEGVTSFAVGDSVCVLVTFGDVCFTHRSISPAYTLETSTTEEARTNNTPLYRPLSQPSFHRT